MASRCCCATSCFWSQVKKSSGQFGTQHPKLGPRFGDVVRVCSIGLWSSACRAWRVCPAGESKGRQMLRVGCCLCLYMAPTTGSKLRSVKFFRNSMFRKSEVRNASACATSEVCNCLMLCTGSCRLWEVNQLNGLQIVLGWLRKIVSPIRVGSFVSLR